MKPCKHATLDRPVCPKCEKRRAYNSTWKRANLEKQLGYVRAWERANPDKKRNYGRIARGMVGVERIPDLLEAQNHCCAICATRGEQVKLVADHDHSTGQIRGLLCHRCNLAIGHFRDDPRLVRLALAYLTRLPEIERESV